MSFSPKCSRSESKASREWRVRMSAMLSTTPSHSRAGLRLSRASSITSSACSTPCMAQYWASGERTAIVAAMRADYRKSGRSPLGSVRGAVADVAIAHARDRRHVNEMQVVAADHDLVAVGQRAPLDALAIDEHAVEAAVVEDAQA